MGNPPLGFVLVSQQKYAEYAQRLGMCALGEHLIVNKRMVGTRTNRKVYVDPEVYQTVMGKRPAH